MDSTGVMTCELKVETQSPGWHKTLIKVLKSIQGVSFTIDAERGIARVSGKIDPDKFLLLLVKAGKHADLLWLDSGNHNTNGTSGHGNVGNMSTQLSNGYGGHYNNYLLYPVIDPYMEGLLLLPPPRTLYYDPPLHQYLFYGPSAPSFPEHPHRFRTQGLNLFAI